MKTNTIDFETISPFQFTVRYIELDKCSIENVNTSHIHDECEIYINLSGDVSFMVENRIYPIKTGDVIITRPYEYHHCIYHSNKTHKHFWILFSSGGNEKILDMFFNRKAGTGNRLSFPREKADLMFELCHSMTEQSGSAIKQYHSFFTLLNLLENAKEIDSDFSYLPRDMYCAIEYINKNISEPLTVSSIAEFAGISVNSLERHFARHLKLSPSEYIRKKRLSEASKLLSQGFSVTETAFRCGFSDYSNFISLFRKNYGITPLKYQKNLCQK